jgi:hypothetical protein
MSAFTAAVAVGALAAFLPPARSASDVALFEFTPWLIGNAGPEKAKGVIYFARGWGQFSCCRNRDDFQMVPYFLKSLSENGWDVLGAKIPEGPRTEFAHEAAPGGAGFLKRRVRELRAQGYKRVVLGGHSWGGWLALLVAQDRSLPLDAIISSSPSTYGPAIIPGGPRKGQPNPNHMRNWTEFRPLIENLATPVVLKVFRDDPFEPEAANRGAYAKEKLAGNKVPHLVFNKPRGFSGHSAPWLPVFDFAFGECMRAFLEEPAVRPCRGGKLLDTDFRSIVERRQIGGQAAKTAIASAAPLAGRKFAAFTLDDSMRSYEYGSARQRINMYSLEAVEEAFEFRNGLHCAGKQCSALVAWSGSEILEFDSASGKLRAWWVEIPR